MSSLSPMSRRRLLTLSGGALGATLLEQHLFAGLAHAESTSKRRFIAFYTGYGVEPAVWYPRGTTGLTYNDTAPFLPGTGLPAMKQLGQNVVSSPLRAVGGPGTGIVQGATGSVSECLDARLNPFLDSMLLVRGVDGTGLKWTGHDPFTAFSARYWPYEDTPKIGQALDGAGKMVNAVTTVHRPMIESKQVYASPPPYWVLCFRSGDDNANHSPRIFIDVRAGKLFEHPIYADPVAAWNSIFAPLLKQTQPSSAPRKLAVELALKRISTLSANPALSTVDKAILEEKAQVLRDAISTMTRPEVKQLIPPLPVLPAKAVDDPGFWGFNDKMKRYVDSAFDEVRSKTQVDLLVAALKLDLTRVFGFLPLNRSANFHTVSHMRPDSMQDGSSSSHMKAVVARYAYLLEKLNVTEPGATGTYLDNTLVQWHSDMGNLNNHNQYDIPTLFAGAKGFLRAGQYLDVRRPVEPVKGLQDPETKKANDKRKHYTGRSHSEALILALKWMRVTPPEWEAFAPQGLLQFCPLVGGYQPSAQKYDYGDKRSALPFSTV